MTGRRRSHVLVKDGDASAEVDEAVRQVGSPDAAGLHRYFFVARANQTVVMADGSASPIVAHLRRSPGWL
ncbi:MAG: hypothetical protein WD766_03930, partial [Gemmatimonadota bacterium]